MGRAKSNSILKVIIDLEREIVRSASEDTKKFLQERIDNLESLYKELEEYRSMMKTVELIIIGNKE
jgi:hypothetical protein